MTIYPSRGPLVRPSTESAQLQEQEREENEEQQGGGGSGGEERDEEEPGDSFASGAELSKKLAKTLGGRANGPRKVAESNGVSVLSIRVKKKQ